MSCEAVNRRRDSWALKRLPSMAIRIGQMIGDPTLTEYVYNKYPLYLVEPWNLPQRFLMRRGTGLAPRGGC